MLQKRVAVVDAFSSDPLVGNPAGVVPDGEELTRAQCKAIARELHVSETVFVTGCDDEKRRVRYYSGSTEVDVCGHATVGLFKWLVSEGEVGAGEYELSTKVGDLSVVVDADEVVWMEYPDTSVSSIDIDTTTVSDAIGVEVSTIEKVELPIGLAVGGLSYVVVPIDLFSSLINAEVNLGKIEELTEAHGADGLYAFTFDTLGPESALHARMWAPSIGVQEDPVTGTASAAVAAYLERYNALDPDQTSLVFEQGHAIDRPGTVRVQTDDVIQVGGEGVVSLTGTMAVPPIDDDDELIEA